MGDGEEDVARIVVEHDVGLDAMNGRNDWEILKARLSMGSSSPRGCKLTSAECRALYEVLHSRKLPSLRDGPDEEAEQRSILLAVYSTLLEQVRGVQTEPAVAATMARYGVSRSAVFAARRRWNADGVEGLLLDETPEGALSWLETADEPQKSK